MPEDNDTGKDQNSKPPVKRIVFKNGTEIIFAGMDEVVRGINPPQIISIDDLSYEDEDEEETDASEG